MNLSRSIVCITMLMVMASTTAASGSIVVSIEPENPTVALGEFVDVDIVATFDEPIVAWGLDITVDVPAYTSWTLAEIGSAWNWPTSGSLDGDALAGLRFPTGVTGEVLLATLTFEGLAEGATLLSLSSGPEEDEGFEYQAGGLAEGVVFESATLTVTPEPTTMALLVASSLLVLRRRR